MIITMVLDKQTMGALSGLASDLMLAMHFDMLRIRRVEEEIAERYSEQEMRCPVHLSVGQEATAVGVCRALNRTDKIFSTHRSHAHYLAKGGDLRKMMAEIYGKQTGCIGGRGGSMHLADPDVGMVLSVPIVASSIPLAVGSALADKRTGKDNVSIAFVGDASLEEGVFHESANFAVLNNLPVLFICENNLYSIYTHINDRQPQRPLVDLAKAHGLTADQGDGNDVVEVYNKTTDALVRARGGGGPSLLIFDTYRWREHCGPNYDNNIGYRTESEFEEWRGKDPIERHRRILFDAGILDEGKEDAQVKSHAAEIKSAFEFAISSPLPSSKQAFDHVYA